MNESLLQFKTKREMKKISIELSQKDLRLLIRMIDRSSHIIPNNDKNKEKYEEVVDYIYDELLKFESKIK